MLHLGSSLKALLLLATFLGSNNVKAASCACGYVDDQGHVWRESIVSDFTQDAGAIAALSPNWIIASDLETQSGTATANIQYTTANVMQFNDALGIQASAVSLRPFLVHISSSVC